MTTQIGGSVPEAAEADTAGVAGAWLATEEVASAMGAGTVLFDHAGGFVRAGLAAVWGKAAARLVPGLRLEQFPDCLAQAGYTLAAGLPEPPPPEPGVRVTTAREEVRDEEGAFWRLVVSRSADGSRLVLLAPPVPRFGLGGEELLLTTLDVMSDAISVVDQDLRVNLYNRNFINFLGFPEEIMTPNTTLGDLFRYNAVRGEYGQGEVEDHVLQRVELARRFEPHTFRRVRPDGRVLEIRGNPTPGGGFVTTYTDITQKARAEGEMRRAKEKAEQALAELKSTQADLIRAEKMASLGTLVAGVAHEINTPVGVGLTSASTLADATKRLRRLYDSDNMSQEDFEGYLETAEEASLLVVNNMLRAAELIQSFKQVAVDQASAERRVFDLAVYTQEILTSLRPAIRKTPHRVETDLPPGVMLDSFPGALAQIITNLVMNAVTHAFSDGQAGVVLVSAQAVGSDDVELTIRDDGVGIPPDLLERIWEPFFTTRRGSGGSGLGLHIVYNLVNATLQGRISVTSESGSGTSFIARIPRRAPILHPSGAES